MIFIEPEYFVKIPDAMRSINFGILLQDAGVIRGQTGQTSGWILRLERRSDNAASLAGQALATNVTSLMF